MYQFGQLRQESPSEATLGNDVDLGERLGQAPWGQRLARAKYCRGLDASGLDSGVRARGLRDANSA